MRPFLRCCVQSDYSYARRLIPVGTTACVEESVERQVLSRKGRAETTRQDEGLAFLSLECLHADAIAFYKRSDGKRQKGGEGIVCGCACLGKSLVSSIRTE